ncbi:hypothetical protein [Actinomyces oris]
MFRSLTQKGFDVSDINHRRANEFLDTYYGQPSNVSCELAILETSGLSRGYFYAREALQSCLSMMLFMQSKSVAQNFISQAKPVGKIGANPLELERELSVTFDASKTLHHLVGTSFIVSTTVIEAVRRQEGWRDSIRNCLKDISRIGYIPPKAAALVALTFAGTPQIRQSITQRLLKTQKTGAGEAFSATIDLAFLILQRIQSMDTERPIVVVTNDDGFADFAGLLTQTDIGDTVPSESFDVKRADEWNNLYGQFLVERVDKLANGIALPDSEHIVTEVARHAKSLNISPPALDKPKVKSHILLAEDIGLDALTIVRDLAFAKEYSDEIVLRTLKNAGSDVTVSDILSASAQIYASLLNKICQMTSVSLDELCEAIPAEVVSMVPEGFANNTEEVILKLAIPISFMNAAARRCDFVMSGIGDRMHDHGPEVLFAYCAACLKILRCVAIYSSKHSSNETAEGVSSQLQALRSMTFSLT